MSSRPRISLLRLAVPAGALGILLWAALLLRRLGPEGMPLPGCVFHRFTGLDCPGCGMTRAAYAALNGDLATAFRFNPVGIFLLPLALLGVLLEVLAWVRRDPGGPRLRPGAQGSKLLALLLVVFWVVRNTPWWPWPLK